MKEEEKTPIGGSLRRAKWKCTGEVRETELQGWQPKPMRGRAEELRRRRRNAQKDEQRHPEGRQEGKKKR